jgi:hypothetical protein
LERYYDVVATTRSTSQRCCDGQQRGVVATTRWTSQRCYDGRQRVEPRSGATMVGNVLDLTTLLRWPTMRYKSGQRYAATFLRFCFFFTQQLEEIKRMGEREKF